MDKKLQVAVIGSAGKMGQEVVKAVSKENDMHVVTQIDHASSPSFEKSLERIKPDVLVDFTRRDSAMATLEIALKHKIACVVGTTGFTDEDIAQIDSWCKKNQTPTLIAPNFAIGAVLLMKFAKEASKYFGWSEIIELHHEKKLDAPSGTSLRTANLMNENRANFNAPKSEESRARGEDRQGIRIHSVRMPGLLAHQEVLFGESGELLTLRHDTSSRECFMPGVILAIRKVRNLKGLEVGLEKIL